MMETIIHPNRATALTYKLRGYTLFAVRNIPSNNMIVETHFRYQSLVYVGVVLSREIVIAKSLILNETQN